MEGEALGLDYRKNLIVDRDNPILVMKAWRDHFSLRSDAVGQAYLGRPNGEDALTWNVFRSLERTPSHAGYHVVESLFGVSDVRNLLFWGCDLEHRGDAQNRLSNLIRRVDGRHAGTMTEIDLLIVAEGEVLCVECKLNWSGSGSPYAARGGGAEKRWKTYREECPELADFEGDWRAVYQLLRNYVYAKLLTADLGKLKWGVCPLVNGAHAGGLGAYYTPLRQFSAERFRPLRTWQDARALIESGVEPLGHRRSLILRKMAEAGV